MQVEWLKFAAQVVLEAAVCQTTQNKTVVAPLEAAEKAQQELRVACQIVQVAEEQVSRAQSWIADSTGDREICVKTLHSLE